MNEKEVEKEMWFPSMTEDERMKAEIFEYMEDNNG